MVKFGVKNFETFQHYKERRPVWIKLYNSLLDDYNFCCLPDASKMHLIAIWLLASRYHNSIPWDEKWISGQISSNSPIRLSELEQAGFIYKINDVNAASNPLATCYQNASLETETETEIEEKINSETFAQPQNLRSDDVLEKSSVVSALDLDFLEWYMAYPRKVGKGQARRAYTAARKKTDHAALLAGAKRYADDPSRKPEFTKHPSTWLNAECWADETVGRLNGGQEKRKGVNGATAGRRASTTPMFEAEPEFGAGSVGAK